MTHHETDALEALRAELTAVAPSPEFAARVRQRIDLARDTDARWWPTWRWLAPAAVVAAGLIAMIAIPRPQPQSRSQAPEQAIAKAPIKAADPLVSSQKPTTDSQRDGSSNFEVRISKFREPAASVEAPFPEVLTNQPEILRALWARVQHRAAVVEPTVETLPAVVPEIVVPPIEVNPVVVKWMVEPPVRSLPPGTSPVIRRVTAETAERSEK